MKKRSIKLYLLISFILIVSLFLILHITPSLAIRSKLFFDGHVIGAFQGKIEFNELQYNLDKIELEKANEKIYCINSANIDDFETGNRIFNFKVKAYGFLYFAYDYGEA